MNALHCIPARVSGRLRALVAVWLLGFGVPALAAEMQSSLELQIKAAFLYNFARFVEWPPDPDAHTHEPIQFCVFGAEPLYEALERSLTGKALNGHGLVVRMIAATEEARDCQVVFVSGYDKRRLGELLNAFTHPGALTVSDGDQFAQCGGMIQLIKSDNRFRFVINMVTVARSGLRISSKLLQLADVVQESSARARQP